ncbi:chemotaxis protein [Pseudomonas sp.]|uniref:chemotaxis protein n=1 Tax=Pseudomonas sp. TaxID=306 RepID=UPI0023534126|nr:chemotaxis protein [Pseudomonas sp.]
MKLVFREYLASLRERDELDVVLPDLLSELGYNVISRPSTGSRQYGVDVAAVSPLVDGERKLFLFSIKQGDLTRAEWTAEPQGMRCSIYEILDAYIPNRISPQFRGLKIVICLCFGGNVHEAVRDTLKGVIDRESKCHISFQEWNGDYMAGLLADGVLQHQYVSKALQSRFQKSIAMLDEPDVSIQHFTALVEGLVEAENHLPVQRLATLRQLYICLSVLFVWARDQQNLEAPFRASEVVILRAWQLIRGDIEAASKGHRRIGLTFEELVELHNKIWDDLIKEKILPLTAHRDTLASSVNSHSPVDVNLKLFELLGRIAVRGLWILWPHQDATKLRVLERNETPAKASALADHIAQLIKNNRALLSPIADEQVIEISCALMFLSMLRESRDFARHYACELLNHYHFNFMKHHHYPSIHASYQELIRHPATSTAEYRNQHTRGSVLIPTVMLWATLNGESSSSLEFSEFVINQMRHCNKQLWIPGPDSESKLYLSETPHGLALCDIPITADGNAAREMLSMEGLEGNHFACLSAIHLAHWPILVMACRHSRLPLPPQLWQSLVAHPAPITEQHAVVPNLTLNKVTVDAYRSKALPTWLLMAMTPLAGDCS